jgi:copper chaperone
VVFPDKEMLMIELRVDKMSCGHCVSVVTKALKEVDPQADVNVDLATKQVRVETRQPREALTRALDAAGYPAT